MTPADLADVVRSIERLDAERDELMQRRNQMAEQLLDRHPSRALAQACGVTHPTILNWAAAAS